MELVSSENALILYFREKQLEEWDDDRDIHQFRDVWVLASSILAHVKIYQIKRIDLAITENRFSLCFITSLRGILTSKDNRLT